MDKPIINSENKKSSFKQGSKRKVNEKNFYLICEYIKLKIESNQSFSLATYTVTENSEKLIKLIEENNYIDVLIGTGPKVKNSKAHIEQCTDESKRQIIKLKYSLQTGDYTGYGGYYKSKEDCEKAIDFFESSIKKSQARYIELTEEMIFKLHMFISDFDNYLYNSMMSWIKQKRYRESKGTNQVTLSNSGKHALDSLKVKLGTKDFNTTLCKLNELH